MANEKGRPEFEAVYGAKVRRAGKPIITENLDAEFSKARSETVPVLPIVGAKQDPRVAMRRSARAQGGTTATTGKPMKKTASGWSADRVYDAPYNPFRNRLTVETPRNIVELNARYRYYAKYEPLVGSAIELHTEFPLSGFNIDHPEQYIADFFNDMMERLDMFDFLLQMSSEYYTIGEAIPFGFFDDPYDPTEWEKFILINPDNIVLETHPMVCGRNNYNIFMSMDASISKIVESGPSDERTGSLYSQIPEDVIAHVKSKKPMQLNDLQVSHFKRRGDAFNLRGESMLSRILHIMAYRDKLRDSQYCLTPDTEVLTARGFVPVAEVTTNDTVATYNLDKDIIENQKPTECQVFENDDIIYHFKTKNKIDFKCTPNHRMLVRNNSRNWLVKRADEVKPTYYFRTNAQADVRASEEAQKYIALGYVDLAGQQVPLKTFLEFAGYFVAEGMAKRGQAHGYIIEIAQATMSPSRQLMEICCIEKMPFDFKPYGDCQMIDYNKTLCLELQEMFGHDSHSKKVPSWMRTLSPEYLDIFLTAACRGDAHIHICKTEAHAIRYSSASKDLADAIQEMAWRAGYCPTCGTWLNKTAKTEYTMYTVSWSKNKDKNKIARILDGTTTKEQYTGNVYCLSVPNGFIVTRLNGRIVIHGNSIADRNITPRELYLIGDKEQPADEEELQAFADLLSNTWMDPNQAIIWHHAVQAQIIGTADKVLPLRQEFTQIEEEMMTALMMNKAFVHGVGPTFANASVALDVLISRYLSFRTQVEKWLMKNVFEPMCVIHDLYKPTKADVDHRIKTHRNERPLYLPNIMWEKNNLRNNENRIKLFQSLMEKGLYPRKKFYRSLNEDPQEIERELTEERRIEVRKPEKFKPKKAPGGAGGMPPPSDMPDLAIGGGMPDIPDIGSPLEASPGEPSTLTPPTPPPTNI